MNRRWVQFFFFLSLSMLSCKAHKERYDNVFYWNIASGVTSLDPAFSRTQANNWVVNQIYNGLVTVDDSLNVIPDIAYRWSISPDGLTYTFNLRPDVYFHDNALFPNGKGRKVVAGDFVFSFNRLLDPDLASPGSWLFSDKTGDNPFKALNDSTFEIKLNKTFRPFLQLLTLKYASVVPQEIVDHFGKDFRSNPVGTGPFFMKYYYEGEKLILHRNNHYFEKENGKSLPYIDAVVISFIKARQNEFFSFMKDKLDIITYLDALFKDNVLTKTGDVKPKFKEKYKFYKTPYLNTEYLGILVDPVTNPNSPLLDINIRKALNYLIDRKMIIRTLLNNIGSPAENGFVPPALMKSAKKYYEFNPSKAQDLIRQSVYKTAENVPPFTLFTTDIYLDMAILVQKQLETAGLRVKVENIPPSSLSEMKAQSKAAFFRGSWVADYADPENYLSLFYSKNWSPAGPNYFHFKDSNFDKLYEESLSEEDDLKRFKFYESMENKIMENAPVIVLYYDQTIRLVSRRVENLNPNPINMVNLKKVRLN